jgi:hypothetical protein
MEIVSPLISIPPSRPCMSTTMWKAVRINIRVHTQVRPRETLTYVCTRIYICVHTHVRPCETKHPPIPRYTATGIVCCDVLPMPSCPSPL